MPAYRQIKVFDYGVGILLATFWNNVSTASLMKARFKNREDAGIQLAHALKGSSYAAEDVVVLALPRGGVPVAYEVAHALGADLDVLVVRKLGLPGQAEHAMGALASGNVIVLDRKIVQATGISQEAIDAVIATEQAELLRREKSYRANRSLLSVAGRSVILVDDGLATGSTMHAAVMSVKKMKPYSITVAVPVAALAPSEAIRSEVDELMCLSTPEPFGAVGIWYEEFPQTSDLEVQKLLSA